MRATVQSHRERGDHARIAARAFNTPLLVEPSKAMAFLSGLGPRILGRRVEVLESEVAETPGSAALPTRASTLAGGLTERFRQQGDAPYPHNDPAPLRQRPCPHA